MRSRTLSRRQFLRITGEAAAPLMAPGCATSPPLKTEVFAQSGVTRPCLGLATSLGEEHGSRAGVTGAVSKQLRGTLYRNGQGSLVGADCARESFRMETEWYRPFGSTPGGRSTGTGSCAPARGWPSRLPAGSPTLGGEPRRRAASGPTSRGTAVTGQAGITVFPWRGMPYAFDECALPCELDPGTLETTGISRLGLPEGFTIYAAHAKRDPRNGDCFIPGQHGI